MIIYEFLISQNQDFTFFRFFLEISSIFRCGHGFCITILLPICCWRLVKNWIFGNATIQNTQKKWEKIKNIKNHDFGILEIVRTTYLQVFVRWDQRLTYEKNYTKCVNTLKNPNLSFLIVWAWFGWFRTRNLRSMKILIRILWKSSLTYQL